ncbi:ergothioneine biosynthesis protein EgtC [Saccharothrix violaceirubra]|uniref:Gamma-glutamyl-hercynylcysteine sulfoxide hydrolase n=1 Tax=Saccharothrix violaceirubra TaxID=413306 RepID=A0A7W7WVV5_9PSEU|nr:ergothioneine biosynthesis protein EgtC [Saccharothrix violaceirubra]MBB4964908.1 glutamine amidotransferase [Saccharothrix violaceirubra]
MCRHLGYLGPAVPLSGALVDAPHSLVHQAYAPRDMRGGGTVNVDGYGVGWYPAPGAAPLRYRRAGQVWADANLLALSRVTVSGAFLAAVRSATVGMPVVDTACAPFTDGRWLFSHNGRVIGWPDAVAPLASRLPVTDLLTLDAPTDAALLWAVVRRRLAEGADPTSALETVVSEVEEAAPGSRLNLMLTDGTVLVATTWWHALWVRSGAGAVTVSSEPLDDDPAWKEVPDRHVVTARVSEVDVRPMGMG